MTKIPPDKYGPVAFDTLGVFEELQEAGLAPGTARAVTEAMARAHIHRGATMADLKEVEYRLDLRLLEIDRKLEVQETRSRVGISAIRKEGGDIRKDILRGLAYLTWTVVALFVLAIVLLLFVPHLPGFPWVDGMVQQTGAGASVGIGR